MAKKGFMEKRVDTRLDVLDYAMIEGIQGNEPIRSVVVDIALGGVQVRTREKLEVGTICHLCMGSVGAEVMKIRGEVRHSKKLKESDLYASGIRFLPEGHDGRTDIAEYLQIAFRRRADFLA